MRKVLIITIIILSSVWVIGIHNINSTQNGYIPPTQNEAVELISVEKVSPLPSTTTTPRKITNKVATTTPKKKLVTKLSMTTALLPEPLIQTPEPVPDFEVINTNVRPAIVNILCTVKNNELSPISGTGVIISSSGIVLTNAHIAQYFLLRDLYVKDYITCVLRTGSPAYPKYKVELAYISPLWVNQNKNILKEQNPQGTGESDFAFLRITGMIDGSALPTIPYITPNAREVISVNEPVILVSYPAGFLGGLSILKDLSVTSGITAVRDYFTFKDSTIDLISVPGTVVSQKGSSGGAVVDKNSTVIGIITTSSDGATTGERDLAAITLGYINRSLKSESGTNLFNFLTLDVETFAKNFQMNQAPELTKIITDAIKQSN